ncbi:MAG: DUF2065 domain-containing protein [Steroidobacteraceae bacterium]
MLNWSDLLAALALYLVLEGILPFANPGALRRAMARFTALSDPQLRIAGLLSMLAGLMLLFVARNA